jgi:hypothetical protein
MEDAGRPLLRTQWLDTATLVLDGETPPDRLVALQVNYDPGWHATQDAREIETAEDRLGYLVLHTTASPASHIELQYRGTREQRVMAMLSGVAWIGALAAALWRRGARYPNPSVRTIGSGWSS